MDRTDSGEGQAAPDAGLAVTVHFFIMWARVYSGVYAWDHVFVNLNRFYIAVLMVATMVVVMSSGELLTTLGTQLPLMAYRGCSCSSQPLAPVST